MEERIRQNELDIRGFFMQCWAGMADRRPWTRRRPWELPTVSPSHPAVLPHHGTGAETKFGRGNPVPHQGGCVVPEPLKAQLDNALTLYTDNGFLGGLSARHCG